MEGFSGLQGPAQDAEDHHMDDAPRDTTNPVGENGLHGPEHAVSPSMDSSQATSLDDELPEFTEGSRRALLPTGCCYDSRMKLHLNADFNPHTHHPEDPRRIHEIFEAFKNTGLVYQGPDAQMARIIRECPTRFMWRIPARYATSQEILLAHTREHLRWVEELDNKSISELRQMTKASDSNRDSYFVGALTHSVARLSCGGAIDTCKAVVSGRVKNAFAVIRPPGHHAEHDHPMGFCFFNNVPVAVRVCQQDYPEICQKVLILDWDVHHGNGIQNIFYDDPNVLYISLHVYNNGVFYPGRADDPNIPDGGIENVGAAEGIGKNVNIGWDDHGMGDGEYLAAFQSIVMPIAREFDPDLVVISAGFDAANGDKLGRCFVTPECYAHMTHMLMSLANGKVAVCLEGGYDLPAISASAVAVAKTLMGEPPPKITIPPLNQQAGRMMSKLQAYQAPYWQCMRGVITEAPAVQQIGGETLLDYMRKAQRQILQSKHKMFPLFVPRERMHKLYEDQVLVTPALNHSDKILVILHDPPEVRAEPDPSHDYNVEPQNSWVVNGVSRYIDWAIAQGFGVIDINVPGYTPDPIQAQSVGFDRVKAAKADLRAQMSTLMPFLWDNYLELSDANEIFVLGVGRAYAGIKELLLGRNCRHRLSGIVGFVTGEIYSVKSDIDEQMSAWYRSYARLYVANRHACWLQEDLKKRVAKRRFGDARRSTENELNEMMAVHGEEVQKWILDKLDTGDDTTEDD